MTEHSVELDQLATALSAAQAEFVAIPKTDTNPFFKSKYAGLPQVVQVASPILTKHGLSVSQFLGFDEKGDTLTTWLLHKSGQYVTEAMRLHSTPGKGQSDVQGQGSAATYARRYAYMSVLGLVADEDDDGAGAGRRAAKQPDARPKTATKDEVREIAAAAKGLSPEKVKLVLASCGIPALEFFDDVPAEKVLPLVKALVAVEREA